MKKINYLFFSLLFIFIRSGQSENLFNGFLLSPHYTDTEDKGIIENLEIDEASGIIVSEEHPDSLWVINDSNDLNRIFLIDKTGGGRNEFFLKGLSNRDWESLAYWKNAKQENFIYIGDIGDNDAKYTEYYIHRFLEPKANSIEFYTGIIKNIESFRFELPDGSRDMESMFVDQNNGDIYLISKREDKKHLYKISNKAFQRNELVEAKFIMRLNFSKPNSELQLLKKLYYLTAADISRNNDEIIIRNYLDVYYWKKNKYESISDALHRDPMIIPSAQVAQGEAIAFAAKGNGYYSISEQVDPTSPVHVYFTKKTKFR